MRKTRLGITAPPRKHEFLTHPIEPWCPWSRMVLDLRRFYGDSTADGATVLPPACRLDGRAYTRPVAGATGRASAQHLPPPLYFTMTLVRIQG